MGSQAVYAFNIVRYKKDTEIQERCLLLYFIMFVHLLFPLKISTRKLSIITEAAVNIITMLREMVE